MSGLRVCLASQTPPAKFRVSLAGLGREGPGPVELAHLQEGVDFDWATGGVPVMVRQLLGAVRELGLWGQASWVSLNPTAPPEYLVEGASRGA